MEKSKDCKFLNIKGICAQAFFVLQKFNNKNVVFVTSDEQKPEELYDAFSGLGQIYEEYSNRNLIYFGENKNSLLSSLSNFSEKNKKPKIVLVLKEALNTPLPSPATYFKANIILKSGENISRHILTEKLASAGYEKVNFVEQPGEYAVRGTVVDIFSIDAEKPFRLYFSLNKITSIKIFDIETQNSSDAINELAVIPKQFEEENSTISNWLEKNFIWVTDEEPKNVKNEITVFDKKYQIKENINFFGNIELLEKEILRFSKLGIQPVISCLNHGEMQRTVELTANTKIPSLCRFKISTLRNGFYEVNSKKAVITTSEIFNRQYFSSSSLKKFTSSDAKRIHFKELKTGDYIVHEDYGIGKYNGIKNIAFDASNESGATDCLEIIFKFNHKLFVPFYDFKKVQKFVSNKAKAPRLSGLDKQKWSTIKARVKEKTRIIAKELLEMQAKRLSEEAPVLAGDEHMESEFADSFPYEETTDQKKAIREVLKDLTINTPTERVLAGDVGFGKTEVALRAALRAVISGKQVFVLVPTTILAAQHYKTFTNRLAGFPVKTALLCRFQTKAEQKEIARDISAGNYDIAIGTHRLFSKDIKAKNLGLVIIDEEHRFGVKQKEKIKAISAGTHCLMLSATPIPRTLNQALTNLKNISVIETPPQGRTAVNTKVLPWNEETAINAITRELARGGQVFYVHNRVRTLPARLNFLKEKLPLAKICMGHGQMQSSTLEKTMWDFFNRKYDILLASTIIESGLDLPQVNTLIVENAHEFGLAQLYQLRGRVGRADKKAFCCFFYPAKLKEKTKEEIPEKFELDFYARYHNKKNNKQKSQSTAFKRLSALEEFGSLGSGMRLALRDLEIRGAGQLLGTKQHGFVNEVGLFLYTQLLNNEVEKLKGKTVKEIIQASFDTDISAYIPADYLPDETERLKYYKKLISADYKHSQIVLKELENLCGQLPKEVKNIVEIIHIRNSAAKHGARHISFLKNTLEVYFVKDKSIPKDKIEKLLVKYSGNIRFKKSTLGDGIEINTNTTKPFQFINEVLQLI